MKLDQHAYRDIIEDYIDSGIDDLLSKPALKVIAAVRNTEHAFDRWSLSKQKRLNRRFIAAVDRMLIKKGYLNGESISHQE